ncbi:hypothetical protein GCM10023334_103020 [Nonomuraea thailandensis]
MTVTSKGLARERHLARRPQGQLSADDFTLVEAPIPELRPGQVLVLNTHLPVDPYMRGRMDDHPSYIPLGAPWEGERSAWSSSPMRTVSSRARWLSTSWGCARPP